LSAPAMIGPNPSPIRSAHQGASNRLSNSFISPPKEKSAEAPKGYIPDAGTSKQSERRAVTFPVALAL
jgi:hypothetical protein